ncbi:MAG: hypothetical protein WAT39_01945 [Planctomycetota bacterium]
MTETDPPALSLVADAPPELPERFRMIRTSLPDLLATMRHYAGPANQVLDTAIKATADQQGQEHAVRRTPHYDVLRAWCAEHPDEAARIVLCAIYIANGRYVAQEEIPPPAPPEAVQTPGDAPVAAAPEAKPEG